MADDAVLQPERGIHISPSLLEVQYQDEFEQAAASQLRGGGSGLRNASRRSSAGHTGLLRPNGRSPGNLIEKMDVARSRGNLCSAIRVFVLRSYRWIALTKADADASRAADRVIV